MKVNPTDDDLDPRILALAPHPSTWTPEQLAKLQQLFGPLYKAARERARKRAHTVQDASCTR